MKCPKCQNPISVSSAQCPNCGADLSLIQAYQSLKTDLEHIQTDTTHILSRISQLHSKFTDFELMVAKPLVEYESPRTESKSPSFKESQKEDAPKPPESSPFYKFYQSIKSETKIPSTSDNPFEIKFGQKWLLIVGVIISVLAVVWFLKFSFEQNWIGPTGRVAFSYLTGFLFISIGLFFKRKNFQAFGLMLIGGGIATHYFATYAAFEIYKLLTQIPAFGVMILITVSAVVLALVFDTKWLAVLGLIGGFMTPILLSTGRDTQIELMSYLLLLNAGVLTIAFLKQWRLLNILGFILTWMLFAGWFFPHYGSEKFWWTFIFLNLFFLIYAFVPLAYHFLKEHKHIINGMGIIIPNSFIAFGFNFHIIDDRFNLESISILTLIYALIFFGMSYLIYRRTPEQKGAYILLFAKGCFFLIITVPLLVSDFWITLFWSVQAMVLIWAALQIENRYLYASAQLFLLLTFFKFFLYDYPADFKFVYPEIYFKNAAASLVLQRILTSTLVCAAFGLSAFFMTKFKDKISKVTNRSYILFWTFFVVCLFVVLNVEVGSFFHDHIFQARFAAISVLWTLFALGLIIAGFLVKQAALRTTALILFAMTIIKVIFKDMSNVSTPYRIISFLVLGLILISASYLYHRFKDRILEKVAIE